MCLRSPSTTFARSCSTASACSAAAGPPPTPAARAPSSPVPTARPVSQAKTSVTAGSRTAPTGPTRMRVPPPPPPPEDDEIFNFAVVEDRPIYPGCENVSKDERYMCFQQGIMKHISINFQYPAIPKEMGVSEKIFVQFIIDKTGKITNALVVRGKDKHLKEEALRLVNSIPKLQPAMQRGKPVPCSFTVPINFKLQ